MSASPTPQPTKPLVEVAITHFKWDHGRGVSFSAGHRHQALLRRLVAARFQQCADEGQTCVKTGAGNRVWQSPDGTLQNRLVLRITWGSMAYDPGVHGILSRTESVEHHEPV